MKRKNLSEAMGDLSDRHIEEVMTFAGKQKKTAWVKWGAVAACFTLLLSLFFLPRLLTPESEREGLGFVITAYAADGSTNELKPNQNIFSSVVPGQEQNIFGVDMPLFHFVVEPAAWSNIDDLTRGYELDILCNGKPIAEMEDHVWVGVLFTDGPERSTSRYFVTGWFTEPTNLKIRIKNSESGELLETLFVRVTYSEEERAYDLLLTDLALPGPSPVPLASEDPAEQKAFVKSFLYAEDEVLALPTDALLAWFLDTECVEHGVTLCMKSSLPPMRFDYTWHDAFCELLAREDFLKALDGAWQGCQQNTEDGRVLREKLSTLLWQPCVQALFEDAYAAGESYPALQHHYHPAN